MHKIPSLYPAVCPKYIMGSMVVNTTRIDAKVLKQLSRMYEAGISIKDISDQLEMDQMTVKKLLKLLGYAAPD
jgi:DNA-binding MarR family transcriptional regulator